MPDKLLVGSVFAPSDRNHKWIELQLRFLRETLDDFVHVVVCNDVDPSLFKESTVIYYGAGKSHSTGLNKIIDYAREHHYSHCLLLDSDCFPFKLGWLEEIKATMSELDVAAIIRVENLDMFAHPSAFYMNDKALSYIKFEIKQGKSIIGNQFHDVQANTKKFLPLMRTNTINIHPIYCGVYGGIFYHHGAGSRSDKNFRANMYYRQLNSAQSEIMGYNRLIDNPKEFIEFLSSGHLRFFKNKVFL
jgi:hypothetical protein